MPGRVLLAGALDGVSLNGQALAGTAAVVVVSAGESTLARGGALVHKISLSEGGELLCQVAPAVYEAVNPLPSHLRPWWPYATGAGFVIMGVAFDVAAHQGRQAHRSVEQGSGVQRQLRDQYRLLQVGAGAAYVVGATAIAVGVFRPWATDSVANVSCSLQACSWQGSF